MAARIDHSGHPHPSTPAARALCRANGGTGSLGNGKAPAKATKPKKITTAPKTVTKPDLTAPAVPVVVKTALNIDTGQQISRQEAAKIMFGTAGAAKKVAPKTVPSSSEPSRTNPARPIKPVGVKRGMEVQGIGGQWSIVSVIEKPKGVRGQYTFRDAGNRIIQRVDADKTVQSRVPVVAKPTASANRKAKAVKAESRGLLIEFKEGVVRRRNLAGGVMAKTELVTTESGHQMVHKTTKNKGKRENDAEELGSLVGRAMGLNIPEVARVNDEEIVMDYIAGAKNGFSLGPGQLDRLMNTDAGKLTGVFDAIFGNNDRHEGNFMVKDGVVHPIDHGTLFSYRENDVDAPLEGTTKINLMERIDGPPIGTGGEFSEFLYERVRSNTMRQDGVTVSYTRWVDNDISPQDINTIETRLAALEPEFKRLGRSDWYDKAVRRLASLKPYAKGTKVRIR